MRMYVQVIPQDPKREDEKSQEITSIARVPTKDTRDGLIFVFCFERERVE